MRWHWSVVAGLVVGCGGSPPPTKTELAGAFVANVRDALRHTVTLGGLPPGVGECGQFSSPQTVGEDKLDALGRCLKAMNLRPSSRKVKMVDFVVMEADGGYELEARLNETPYGPQLAWIGFEPTATGMPGEATLTPVQLAALRTSPEEHLPPVSDQREVALLEICLDPAGAASVTPREATSQLAASALASAARAWTYKPFAVGGDAVPACATIAVETGAAATSEYDLAGYVPLPPPEHLRGVTLVPNKQLGDLESGETVAPPDDMTKVEIARAGIGRVVSVFAWCVDETGKVRGVDRVRSTGYPRYDAILVHMIESWKYAPYREHGTPTGTCTSTAFVYHQRGGAIQNGLEQRPPPQPQHQIPTGVNPHP